MRSVKTTRIRATRTTSAVVVLLPVVVVTARVTVFFLFFSSTPLSKFLDSRKERCPELSR